MSEYPNWFTCYADDFFARHLSPLAGRPGLEFLQVGAFTGDASLWLFENILTDPYTFLWDVDTWAGSDEPEHEPFDFADVEATYDAKLAQYVSSGRLFKHRMTSEKFFATEAGAYDDDLFDFVYIDGAHTAPAVLDDAIAGFRFLKPGGLMAFDDYQWKPHPEAPAHLAPAMAVDTFTACYQDRLEILEAGLQVWVRKIA